MLVVLKPNYEELSLEAARIVANAVRQNPEVRLGLATGSTTIGVYRELARLHREESLDFSRVVTFNLDEYLGISPQHPHSFHQFMSEHFFLHVNVNPRNIHIPDGTISGEYENIALVMKMKLEPRAESICKSWASGAMGTSASTSRLRVSRRKRG